MCESRVKSFCSCALETFLAILMFLVDVVLTILYCPFQIFLYLTTVGFYCVWSICDEINERDREAQPQSVPQPSIQDRPTPDSKHTGTNSGSLCSRPSMGRILKPDAYEESGESLESPESDGSNSTPGESKPTKQHDSPHGSVLSADFGDNEILAVEESACAICLVEYQHGEEIQRNGFFNASREGGTCDHVFHPDCISTWIKSSGKAECPCCRRPFGLDAFPV